MFEYSAGLMISVLTPISSVRPSGGDFATAPAPRLPEAPGRLSTTIACPHADWKCGASVRARMSIPVPGVNGTTMRRACPASPAARRRACRQGRRARCPRARRRGDDGGAMRRDASASPGDGGPCDANISPAASAGRRPACRLGDSRQLLARDDVLDARERLVAGSLVDFAQDRVGRRAAVGEHDLRRRGVADGVVLGERCLADAALGEPLGEAERIEDRLAGAVRAARDHRMRGVAEQRDAAKAPARQRVLVDHRVGEDRLGRADHRGTSSQSKCQSAKRGEEVVEACRARSSRAARRLGDSSSATQLTSWRPSPSMSLRIG